MDNLETVLQHTESILVSLAFFGGAVLIVIIIINFILKMRLISSGQTDPEVLKILSNAFDQKIAVLKWGVILLFGGVGLVVINFIPAATIYESPLAYGIEMIFVAAGFLTYYFIACKEENKL